MDLNRTEILYKAMKAFTDARSAARETYLQTMKKYEADKGSSFYADKMNQAMTDRRGAVDMAKAAAWDTVSVMIKGMREHASKRKMTAPTDEQLRILTALQMRGKLTLNELEQAANAMDGNGAGLAILEEIAQKHALPHPNFNAMSKDSLSLSAANEAIDGLLAACKRILNSNGADRAADMAAARHAKMYGKTEQYDSDDLPQEAPYESEQDFYSRNVSMPYNLFAEAVNGLD